MFESQRNRYRRKIRPFGGQISKEIRHGRNVASSGQAEDGQLPYDTNIIVGYHDTIAETA